MATLATEGLDRIVVAHGDLPRAHNLAAVADFDGVVADRFVDNFQNVRVKQPVIRFLDVSKLEMVINIPENLINYSKHVGELRVRFDALPGVEILVVDDSRAMRRIVSRTIRQAGYEGHDIVEAENGREALEVTTAMVKDADCKVVLTLCMLFGRLEVFTVLVVFFPAFWRK